VAFSFERYREVGSSFRPASLNPNLFFFFLHRKLAPPSSWRRVDIPPATFPTAVDLASPLILCECLFFFDPLPRRKQPVPVVSNHLPLPPPCKRVIAPKFFSRLFLPADLLPVSFPRSVFTHLMIRHLCLSSHLFLDISQVGLFQPCQ